MKKKIFVIVMLLVLVAGLSGCTEQEKPDYENLWFEVISKSAEREENKTHIYATIFCRGDSGGVNVWASVTQDGRTYKDVKHLNLQENQKIDVTFTFDITTSGYNWNVWLEY